MVYKKQIPINNQGYSKCIVTSRCLTLVVLIVSFSRLLVLASQSTQLPITFSLNTRIPQPTAGESAIKDLLRLVRNPRPESDPRNPRFKGSPSFQTRAPSFLSGGLPRDRRGRVALKGKNPPDLTNLRGLGFGSSEDPYGDDTPRMGGIPASYAMDMERERDREFLEGLRLVLISFTMQFISCLLYFQYQQQSRC